MKRGFIILLLSVGLLSCEKVIEVPLDEAEQQIVVEGNLFDYPDSSFVKLSKTGSVYDDSGFEKISGAIVLIEDEQGNVVQFAEDATEAGTYRDALFIAQANNTYHLTVITGEDTLKSTSYAKAPVSLDALFYQEQIGSFGGSNDTTYLVFYSFTDIESQKNYYRIIPYINGDRSDMIYLQEDQLFNGSNVSAPFFAESIEAGDTVFVELRSMDKANFRYFNSLSNAGGGAFAPTPANPDSNIEGGALGYFGVYTTAHDTIILPE